MLLKAERRSEWQVTKQPPLPAISSVGTGPFIIMLREEAPKVASMLTVAGLGFHAK